MLDQQHSEIVAINKTKGHDYAGEEDALSNFKRNADRLGLTPIQVWGVYFHKHLDAIETYVREGGVASEPIEGRIQDAAVRDRSRCVSGASGVRRSRARRVSRATLLVRTASFRGAWTAKMRMRSRIVSKTRMHRRTAGSVP
jgi:hypothetical protein